MIKIFRILIVMCLLTGATLPGQISADLIPLQKNAEFEYQSVAYSVRMKFPSAFTETVTPAKTASGNSSIKVQSELGDQKFVLAVSLHDAVITGPEAMPATLLINYASEVKGDTWEQWEYTFRTHKVVAALLYIRSIKYFCEYRVFVVGKRQYQMMVLSKNEILSAEGQAFFDSFKF